MYGLEVLTTKSYGELSCRSALNNRNVLGMFRTPAVPNESGPVLARKKLIKVNNLFDRDILSLSPRSGAAGHYCNHKMDFKPPRPHETPAIRYGAPENPECRQRLRHNSCGTLLRLKEGLTPGQSWTADRTASNP